MYSNSRLHCSHLGYTSADPIHPAPQHHHSKMVPGRARSGRPQPLSQTDPCVRRQCSTRNHPKSSADDESPRRADDGSHREPLRSTGMRLCGPMSHPAAARAVQPGNCPIPRKNRHRPPAPCCALQCRVAISVRRLLRRLMFPRSPIHVDRAATIQSSTYLHARGPADSPGRFRRLRRSQRHIRFASVCSRNYAAPRYPIAAHQGHRRPQYGHGRPVLSPLAQCPAQSR